ncbi:hypothetical protein EMCG_01613 [[Emmonsia] crescens]|uniref:Uncharacterized protein n=1 Tax=[Emmonsia] crescens TaxID=73230 RepID=A0A0G2I1T1_9EURO|nr:hypothetical protein EMCG_01613 [Emmonsia crescens UAMH 3008]
MTTSTPQPIFKENGKDSPASRETPTETTISTAEKGENREPRMKGCNETNYWERERLGPNWMDGTPFLNPDQHPLWKGFCDTHEITAERLPPFNRTLILEQYRVLEGLAEKTENKLIPAEDFGKFWPRHFFPNGKPKGESSAPYDAEAAKHLKVNLQVLTYYCNGRPQIDMPDRMRNVFFQSERKFLTATEKASDLVEENRHLKEQERSLREVIKTLGEEKKAMQTQWNQTRNHFNTQMKSYESRIFILEQGNNAAALNSIKRKAILSSIQELRHHVEELASATSEIFFCSETLPEITIPELPTATASPGKKRFLPQDGTEEKITGPQRFQEGLQVGTKERSLRASDGSLDDHLHVTKLDSSASQAQRAVKKLKAENASEQTSVLAALEIPPADNNSSGLVTLSLACLVPSTNPTVREKPSRLSSVLANTGIPEKHLQKKGGVISEKKTEKKPQQNKSLGTESKGSTTRRPTGSSSMSSGKPKGFVPGLPDFTGIKTLSNKLHPELYVLARKAKYFALMKFGVVPLKLNIPGSADFSQAEQFFALILWQGYQTKIADLLQETDRFKQLCGRKDITSFKDPGFANGDPISLTQTALDEGALTELSNIALRHLVQRNPATKKNDLQSAIRKPFRYTGIRELSDDLTKKGLISSDEDLVQDCIDVLKPRFQQELHSCSNQIPTLLVFTPSKLTAANRFNLQTEVHFHLEEENGDLNSEAVADVLTKEEFTFRELTDFFTAQGWKYNSGVLAKAVFNYEATSRDV